MSEARYRVRDESVITGAWLKEFIENLSSKVSFTKQVEKPTNPPPMLYFNSDF